MAGHLGERGERRVLALGQVQHLVRAAHADDDDALGAQVHGWGERRGLAHRTIAQVVVLAAQHQLGGRKDEGDRRRGHQVLVADAVLDGAALRARPGRHMRAGFIEGDVLASGVARCGDRQRRQLAAVQQVRDFLQRQLGLEQLQKRRIVQQRARFAVVPARQRPAQRQQAQPARAAAHHTKGIGAVDLAGGEIAPHPRQALHGQVEMVGAAGKTCGIDRAGRGAHGDGEGRGFMVGPGVLAQARERLQHPHLVGGTRAAA